VTDRRQLLSQYIINQDIQLKAEWQSMGDHINWGIKWESRTLFSLIDTNFLHTFNHTGMTIMLVYEQKGSDKFAISQKSDQRKRDSSRGFRFELIFHGVIPNAIQPKGGR